MLLNVHAGIQHADYLQHQGYRDDLRHGRFRDVAHDADIRLTGLYQFNARVSDIGPGTRTGISFC